MGPEFLLLAQLGAGSPDAARITARQLIDAPKAYVDRRVALSDLPCVNDPKGGFVCVGATTGRGLRIEASGLGARTSLRIAELLLGECKGTYNLKNPACRFDVEIKPISAFSDVIDTPSGSLPYVQVYSGQVELSRPKR